MHPGSQTCPGTSAALRKTNRYRKQGGGALTLLVLGSFWDKGKGALISVQERIKSFWDKGKGA